MNLEEKVQKFEKRWNEIHSVPNLKARAGRKYDPIMDDLELVPTGKIERIGDCLVYPNPHFYAWYDVKTTDGIVVGFSGELAHRNAMQWARNWNRSGS